MAGNCPFMVKVFFSLMALSTSSLMIPSGLYTSLGGAIDPLLLDDVCEDLRRVGLQSLNLKRMLFRKRCGYTWV